MESVDPFTWKRMLVCWVIVVTICRLVIAISIVLVLVLAIFGLVGLSVVITFIIKTLFFCEFSWNFWCVDWEFLYSFAYKLLNVHNNFINMNFINLTAIVNNDSKGFPHVFYVYFEGSQWKNLTLCCRYRTASQHILYQVYVDSQQ